MFSKRISAGALAEWCRTLKHLMDAGVPLARSMKQQGKSGPRSVRAISTRLAGRLEKGNDLASSLQPEAELFPPLLLALAEVGEESGRLPDVFGELEEFFEMQAKLKKRFLGQIAWPVAQFVMAALIIAALMFILGMISEGNPGQKPIAPIGMGLTGASGALIFLGSLAALVVLIYALYRLVRRMTAGTAGLDVFLLRVPIIGPCLRAFALARFSMGLQITSETGMPVHDALRLSLSGTGNQAFAAASPAIEAKVRSGKTITKALKASGLFPSEYLAVVETGELTGNLPEVMKRQATYYSEEAGRKLAFVSSAAAKLVYALVAVFIIFTIFRLYSIYFGALGGV